MKNNQKIVSLMIVLILLFSATTSALALPRNSWKVTKPMTVRDLPGQAGSRTGTIKNTIYLNRQQTKVYLKSLKLAEEEISDATTGMGILSAIPHVGYICAFNAGILFLGKREATVLRRTCQAAVDKNRGVYIKYSRIAIPLYSTQGYHGTFRPITGHGVQSPNI